MFKLNEIKQLIEILDKSTIEEFEIENETNRLYISKPKQQAPVIQASAAVPSVQMPQAGAPAQQAVVHTEATPGEAQSAEAETVTNAKSREGLVEITSPMVGTFYEAASPGADPFVRVGEKISENTVVCIVEAMKLMNEIEAEVKGEIVEVLVQNAQLVEFGQPLFLVKPE